MKNPRDPRHLVRIRIIQELFEWGIRQSVHKRYHTLSKKVINNIRAIDSIIEKEATKWPKEKINNVDLAILRLAIYELMIDRSQPVKVIVDEGVELAKQFGGDNSPDFVNGVLGACLGQLETNNDSQ